MSSRLPLFHLDAFTRRPFGGNPAAVILLESWPDDALLQAIAQENNLSETAFLVRRHDAFDIRWFTPTVEVDLCGHATLASGWVVLHRLEPSWTKVVFHSKSGPLEVERAGTGSTHGEGALAMRLPAHPAAHVDGAQEAIARALGAAPVEVLAARDYLVVFEREEQVRSLTPDMAKVAALERFGVIVTAPSSQPGVDFVSRFFAPREGIPEDPVTGSAHCSLVPYWSKRLGRTTLEARQISARGGELSCVDEGATVRLIGHAALYLEGEIAF